MTELTYDYKLPDPKAVVLGTFNPMSDWASQMIGTRNDNGIYAGDIIIYPEDKDLKDLANWNFGEYHLRQYLESEDTLACQAVLDAEAPSFPSDTVNYAQWLCPKHYQCVDLEHVTAKDATVMLVPNPRLPISNERYRVSAESYVQLMNSRIHHCASIMDQATLDPLQYIAMPHPNTHMVYPDMSDEAVAVLVDEDRYDIGDIRNAIKDLYPNAKWPKPCARDLLLHVKEVRKRALDLKDQRLGEYTLGDILESTLTQKRAEKLHSHDGDCE